MIKFKKINKITEASFWIEYEGSEITFSFSYLKRVISWFSVNSIFFQKKCNNMKISLKNSGTSFLLYIYGTGVNKKFMPHLDKVEKNLFTNMAVYPSFWARL